MISKETKTFTIAGKEMRFNRDAFNQAILLYSRQHHMKIGKVKHDRAEELFDRCSVPAAQALGQLNEFISAYVSKGVRNVD